MLNFDMLIHVLTALETGSYEVPGKGSDMDECLWFLADYFTTWF